MQDTTIENRKQSHLMLAQSSKSQVTSGVFNEINLPYRALPELNLEEVDTGADLFGKKLSQPLIIASMTGGTKHAATINRNLAIAAQDTQIAMGVGSQRIALEIPQAKETFSLVRTHAPDIALFANLAAVQLNYGFGVDECQRVVDMIQADAFYLHLNPLQEALQPGGDTNFANLLSKIEALVEKLGVPVWVKEVGHGLDARSISELVNCGVSGIDVAGMGGTSWAWIEATRDDQPQMAEWFKNFGIPTPQAIKEARQVIKSDAALVASGGIRNPLDGLKSRTLGADYYSAARPFLLAALESERKVIQLIDQWQRGLKIGMFCIGAKNWDEVSNHE